MLNSSPHLGPKLSSPSAWAPSPVTLTSTLKMAGTIHSTGSTALSIYDVDVGANTLLETQVITIATANALPAWNILWHKKATLTKNNAGVISGALNTSGEMTGVEVFFSVPGEGDSNHRTVNIVN